MAGLVRRWVGSLIGLVKECVGLMSGCGQRVDVVDEWAGSVSVWGQIANYNVSRTHISFHLEILSRAGLHSPQTKTL